MPRKTLVRSKQLPYHITARANNREPFHLPLEVAWSILEDELYASQVVYGLKPHAAVLMPNHLHLIASTPEADLGEAMMHFLRSLTRRMNSKSGRSGRVFGARYHWSLIDSDRYFATALKYLYRNPVRAQLCRRAEDYLFSTLPGRFGLRRLGFPIHYPFGIDGYLNIPSEPEPFLEWLNRPFEVEMDLAIQQGLRRTHFRIRSGRKEPFPVQRQSCSTRPGGD